MLTSRSEGAGNAALKDGRRNHVAGTGTLEYLARIGTGDPAFAHADWLRCLGKRPMAREPPGTGTRPIASREWPHGRAYTT
ncbi:unnamed protein product [Lampetra fluviatilis]